MNYINKIKLASVHQLCNKEGKSTEYMLQVMQDTCKVDLDTCIAYINLGSKEHSKLFKELNSLIEVVLSIEKTIPNVEVSDEEQEWMDAPMGHFHQNNTIIKSLKK